MPRRLARARSLAHSEAPDRPASPVRTTRTTLVLPETLDLNLELFAVKSGLSKGEAIKKVLAEYLRKEGFQPDKRPKSVDIVY
jgi:hypothetical protein